MYPSAESESTVVYNEPLFVDKHYFFIIVSIGEVPMKENTASEASVP